jgi:hypothetical protein
MRSVSGANRSRIFKAEAKNQGASRMKVGTLVAATSLFLSIFQVHSSQASTVSDVTLAGGGAQITLSGVAFFDTGLLNGSVTLNQFGGVAGYNLSTTGGAFSESYTTAGGATNAPQSKPNNAPTVLDFFADDAPFTSVLQLAFSGDLLSGGASLLGGNLGPSYECTGSFSCFVGSPPAGGEVRFVEAAATPLPSTWIMLLCGLLGLGLFVHRGSMHGTAVATA